MEKDNNPQKKEGILHLISRALGFYRNPPYIENQLQEADVRSALYLSAIVGLVEVLMIVRYIQTWVLTGQVESLGEFFHYTYSYWILLAASVLLCIYCGLYLKRKLKKLNKFSSVIIFLYFLLGMYFSITTSQHDFSRGRMIIYFLTVLMWVTVICVWRPFSSILLVCVFGGGFLWLLNNRTFDKAGTQVQLSDGDQINFITFMMILFILEVAVYFQRYSDAKKSYRLELSSVTDDLTGMPNMRKLDSASREYIETGLAEGKSPIYLVFNISNFQTFNDRFNYSGGDTLLVKTGKIITAEFPNEPVARESGDIFSVLTKAEDFYERASNVRKQIKEAYPTETYLDVKVGAYRATDSIKNPRHAIDRARYALKSLHNKEDEFFIEYDQKMDREYSLKQYVLNNVEKAVREGYVQVYYQPVIWSEDEKLAGCEALARWIDPEMGFLSPGVFISTLEEGRQIHKLDLCIYESVCKQIRHCMDNGLPVLPTSLNFSRLDFELMDAVGEMEKLVEKYRVPRNLLHIEITESAITKDVSLLKNAISQFHEKGYEVWLDDFGSGYSSMNVLKDYNFDLLKIDMEFLRDFNKDSQNSRKIISTVIELANKLHMETLAEGVETREAINFLKEAGCGRLQGYFYGKPMPYSELLAKISDGSLKVRSKK